MLWKQLLHVVVLGIMTRRKECVFSARGILALPCSLGWPINLQSCVPPCMAPDGNLFSWHFRLGLVGSVDMEPMNETVLECFTCDPSHLEK